MQCQRIPPVGALYQPGHDPHRQRCEGVEFPGRNAHAYKMTITKAVGCPIALPEGVRCKPNRRGKKRRGFPRCCDVFSEELRESALAFLGFISGAAHECSCRRKSSRARGRDPLGILLAEGGVRLSAGSSASAIGAAFAIFAGRTVFFFSAVVAFNMTVFYGSRIGFRDPACQPIPQGVGRPIYGRRRGERQGYCGSNSTRRFLAWPSSVAFEATGAKKPTPEALSRCGLILYSPTSALTTAAARARDKSRLES